MDYIFDSNTLSRPLRLFEELSAIPRGTGNENDCSNYLFDWGMAHGLKTRMDAYGNVLIRKPGTLGYEESAPVLLQAHMDMVCEKLPDSPHNFETDPISLQVKGDLLQAKGTTLGADDGIGVGLCLAALEAEDVEHPPLEVLFTVGQNDSFCGASHFATNQLHARRMISLDNQKENQVVVAGCGGVTMEVTLPVEREEATIKHGVCYEIAISGLTGGHSGTDIHRGYPTATQLMIRVLRQLLKQFDIGLVSLQSGNSKVALSRDCKAVVITNADPTNTVRKLKLIFAHEYQSVCPGLTINVTEIPRAETKFTGESFQQIMTLLTMFPDGVKEMNGRFPGTVSTSSNMGHIYEQDYGLVIETVIRGAHRSNIQDLCDRIICLADLTGAFWEKKDEFAPWEYAPDSPLQKTATALYRELFQSTMEPVMLHAGIECGVIRESISDMDCIAIGPDCENLHSPSEALHIRSTEKMWEFLQELLKKLK